MDHIDTDQNNHKHRWITSIGLMVVLTVVLMVGTS